MEMSDYKQEAQRYRDSLADYDNPDMFSLGYQWADKKHRHVYDLCKLLEDAAADLAAERERVEAWKDLFSDEAERTANLREALKPFAKAAENFDDFPIKDAEQWFVYSGQQSHNETRGAITVGDLRRARAVLAETKGGGDE
jgi:hypothetical protein